MDQLIGAFEISHPGWGWLIRNQHPSVAKKFKGYMVHVTHPLWDAITPGGSPYPHYFGYGDTAKEAFIDAMDKARMQ